MGRILIGDASEILVGREWPRPLLPPRPERRLAAVLTQPGASGVADRIARRLQEEGHDAPIHVLPDGEGAKTLAAVEGAYRWLADHRLGRGDTVVAVGGGATSDAAGFVAGTWMRGIEAVYVPTTLLGAVDAAIGGKTGVNLGGKNLVGVFWHPRRVIVDLDVLEGLPMELKRQGAAEVIKSGLLADPAIVDAYRRHGLRVAMEDVVADAIRVKAEIVAADFTETGRRALLNLGHTIGHGVEYASKLSHGESVALGLVSAGAVSERLLGFTGMAHIEEALEATGLPRRSPPLDHDLVVELIGLDKKRVSGRTRMVLLEAVGRPRLMEVESADVDHGLAAIGV